MHRGIKLGRVLGIDVSIDYSWVFVFLLMSWNLTVVFGRWHPTWLPPASIALAVVATLAFFASVLLHELAHALVAQSFGMRVKEIRLFLFGGVSNIEKEPPSAKAELWMAIAGPVASIVLGLELVVLGAVLVPNVDATDPLGSLSRASALSTLLLWLGPVNVAVGLFNLIPGFPLDGGRVLRAILWAATKKLDAATLWAATIGQAIGWTFVITGVAVLFGARVPLVGQGAVSGLWLAFIGWFLSSAAQQSYQRLVLQEVLEGVRVAQLMRRTRYFVPAGTTVGAVAQDWFMRSSEHAFPVMKDDALVGLVSVGDIRRAPRDVWQATRVEDLMTPLERLVVATPQEDVESALRKLGEADVEQLPVVENGQMVGMIERRDIARWLELRLGADRRFQRPRPVG